MMGGGGGERHGLFSVVVSTFSLAVSCFCFVIIFFLLYYSSFLTPRQLVHVCI